MNAMHRPLQSLEQALPTLLQRAHPLGDGVEIDTFEADGRVLALDLVAPLQVPPFDNSAMDGYALRCADVSDTHMLLSVSQRIAAGSLGTQLKAQTAARIFTGAPIPPGADAVVMQENVTVLAPDQIRLQSLPKPGQCIRRSGEDIRMGQTVLCRGTRLGPAQMGLVASLGLDRVSVAMRPRVALFSTGNELIMPGSMPVAALPVGAIYNSNRFFLRALLRRLGCEVSDFGIVPDQRFATVQALAQAAQDHDLILTSGGVSVGDQDHIKPAVETLGELHLWSLAIKPGKPFAFGCVRRKQGAAHFIGLPGNPVSSFITFLLLVRPFLLRLQGAIDVLPQPLNMRADFEWKKPDSRREFLRVRKNDRGGLELFPNQSSGVLTSLVWGDGVIDLAPGTVITQGQLVPYISFAQWLS